MDCAEADSRVVVLAIAWITLAVMKRLWPKASGLLLPSGDQFARLEPLSVALFIEISCTMQVVHDV